VVYLYDDDMQLKSTYSFASATVFMVALNESGNRLAIFKTETAIDKFATGVMVTEPGKKTSLFDIRISTGIVCGGGFTKDGKLQLITTDGYYLIDSSNGKTLANTAFDRAITRVSVTNEGCAVALTNNSGEVKNSILAFDKNGKQIYDYDFSGGILDMEYHDGYVFINQGDSITKITLKGGNISKINVFEKTWNWYTKSHKIIS
jgi:flagellar basal body rod protein FlgG